MVFVYINQITINTIKTVAFWCLMPCRFVVTCQPCGSTNYVDDGSKLLLDMIYLSNYTVSCARIQANILANGVKMLHF